MPAGGGPHAAIRQKPTPAGACDGGALLRPAGMNGVGGGTYIFWRHEESPMRFPAPIGEDRREDIRLVCSKMQLVCSVAFKCISDHKFNVSYVFWRVLDMPLACFDLFRM